jgi:hypothetical protein
MTGIFKNDQNVCRLDAGIAWLNHYGMIFHEQQECGNGFPSQPLRHVWPEVVMENHAHTPAVHGKSHT